MTDEMNPVEYRSQLGIQNGYETRALGRIEVRAEGEEYKFRGLASATDVDYTVHDMFGSFTERILEGSFTNTLAENPDVQLLIMHDGLPLARTRAETMRLWESERGLEVEALLATNDYRANMVRGGIERGDITEMSFMLRVEEQEWSPDYTHRTISRVNLHRSEVSIVGFGANPHTEISRGKDEKRPKDDDDRSENTDMLLQLQAEEELLLRRRINTLHA